VFARGVKCTCLHLSANHKVDKLSLESSIFDETVAIKTIREFQFKVFCKTQVSLLDQ